MTGESHVPPVAKAVPYTFEHLGHRFVDNYAWLQNRADPAVRAYLEAENAYARASLQRIQPLRERLFAEMRYRIPEDDSSVPQRRGEYLYYWRIQSGQQYRVFCRKRDSPLAAEEVLLDLNTLAEGKTYCQVAVYQPSPDNALLAYAVDTTGAWIFDLYIKDLRTGEQSSGPIPNTAWTVAWASDSHTLFYTVFDDLHRAYKLLRHRVGDDPANDVLVYHEADEAFEVCVKRTRSGAYLLLMLRSNSTSEVRYLAANQPTGEFRVIHPRQHRMEYEVEHHGGRFLIQTNDQAPNFKLVEAPVDAPEKANWCTILPHRPDTLIEEIHAFRDHLVILERQGGLRHIRISNPDGLSNVRDVAFPESLYTFFTDTFGHQENPEFDTTLFRFTYSSFVTSHMTVDYDMVHRTWEVKKQLRVSGYDPSAYEYERLAATAPDGTAVPISLVFRKGLRRDGSHPLLWEGYGSYGCSMEPGFDVRRLSLLDRGFVYALAHVRGGNELGRAWFEQGRLIHKKNSFTDLIACAEHLVAQGYTSPERQALMGVSAGGLLVAAVANMRPDLFKAMVALMPFTNVISTVLNPDMPLTVTEYEHWGHPDDPKAFEYMLSYSPYENVEAKKYPHMYVKTGWNDLQVLYWDPAKWVAKLRAYRTDANELLLITHMGAGHGGASGRYDHLREDANVHAFLIDALGAPTEPVEQPGLTKAVMAR